VNVIRQLLIYTGWHRKVTITGTPEAIEAAESMIMERVSASAER
jgi:hypothetical protein